MLLVDCEARTCKMWLEGHSPPGKNVCDAKAIFGSGCPDYNPKMPLVMEVAFRSMQSLKDHLLASSRALALTLLIFLSAPIAQAFAARLGGAYYVDDAEIEKQVLVRSSPGARLPLVAIESLCSVRLAW
jgi:hypothetical protein